MSNRLPDGDKNARRILTRLRRLSHRLRSIETERDELYRERIQLFYEGQANDPKLTHAALAEACSLSEEAVTLAFRKDKERKAKEAAAKGT